MTNHRSHIQPGMKIVHKLTGQYGVVRELGLIGTEVAALVQWLDRSERRDGEPDWALTRNLDRPGDAPQIVSRQPAKGRGTATGRSQSQ